MKRDRSETEAGGRDSRKAGWEIQKRSSGEGRDPALRRLAAGGLASAPPAGAAILTARPPAGGGAATPRSLPGVRGVA